MINWNDIDLKGKTKGTKKTTCPSCSHDRNKKTDPCLSVDIDNGVAFCHHCSDYSIKESEQKESHYILPKQDWSNYTSLSDAMVKWLEDRRISQLTAIELKITEELHYIPQSNKEQNCIVFNYFEGQTVVAKKYRSGAKHFAKSKDSKSIFYNINSIIGQETAYIVEGEMDVLAMHELGIKNVISVPNGANDNDNQYIESERYLKGIKRFIIATDNDTKGIELREKISHRLGKYRCEFIEFKGKDANDDLISGDLEQSIKQAKKFPVGGTYTSNDLMDGIMELYRNGLPKTLTIENKSFGTDFNKVFSPMLGQVTTITGIPSGGKSNFNDWYVINLINEYKLKGSWFSPEHSPMELYQTNLIEKVTGRNFYEKVGGKRITEEGILEYNEWAKDKIYLTDCEDGEVPTWTWLMDKFKEQLYSYGINIFVIDAFNKVILPSGNKLDAINDVMTKLTHFAQSNNVAVFLVAHPTKMRKDEKTGLYDVPTLYDVSGSADFRNQTHNGYTIHRMYGGQDKAGIEVEQCTLFINTKTKYNFQGQIGEQIKFQYEPLNGRYYANGVSSFYNLIHGTKSIEIPNEAKPLIPLSEDWEDYVPF